VSSRLITGLRKGISVAALVPQPGRGWQGQEASSEGNKRSAAGTVVNSGCNAGTGDPVPPRSDARKSSVRRDAGVRETKVRRAARRLCRSEVGLVCMPRFRGSMRGGADCARARISPDGVRIRQAVACRLFATRTRAALSDGWHRPARAGPCVDDPGTPGRLTLRQIPSRIRKAARHRPVSTLTLTAGRRWPAQGARISPVAGLADPPRRASRKGTSCG
jgi:hypothetical protein